MDYIFGAVQAWKGGTDKCTTPKIKYQNLIFPTSLRRTGTIATSAQSPLFVFISQNRFGSSSLLCRIPPLKLRQKWADSSNEGGQGANHVRTIVAGSCQLSHLHQHLLWAYQIPSATHTRPIVFQRAASIPMGFMGRELERLLLRRGNKLVDISQQEGRSPQHHGQPNCMKVTAFYNVSHILPSK